MWSLTITDIATGWTECRATWGKGSVGVLAQIQDVENHLPFKLKGFDCDNGSTLFAERLQPLGAPIKIMIMLTLSKKLDARPSVSRL